MKKRLIWIRDGLDYKSPLLYHLCSVPYKNESIVVAMCGALVTMRGWNPVGAVFESTACYRCLAIYAESEVN